MEKAAGTHLTQDVVDPISESANADSISTSSTIFTAVFSDTDDKNTTVNADSESDAVSISSTGSGHQKPRIRGRPFQPNDDVGRQTFFSTSARIMVEQQNTKYTLRQHFNRQNFRGSGWQDKDDTGTYDPTIRPRAPRSKVKRPNTSKSGSSKPENGMRSNDEGQETATKEPTKALNYHQDGREGSSLIVTLKFNSTRGLYRYTEYCYSLRSSDDADDQNKSYKCSDAEINDFERKDCDQCRVPNIQCLTGAVEHQNSGEAMGKKGKSKESATEVFEIPRRLIKCPKKRSCNTESNLLSKKRRKAVSAFSPDGKDNLERTAVKVAPVVADDTVLHITTSYCHPIAFNFNSCIEEHMPLKDSGLPPCNFCMSPGIRYALFGLGARRVEVIKWSDPRKGYEELGNGHAEEGCEASRMCIRCTSERLNTMMCTKHMIRRIKGRYEESFDYMKALGSVLLVEDEDRKENYVEEKWCSICIAPAFYECCTIPKFDFLGHSESCGLLLCEVCAAMMKNGDDKPDKRDRGLFAPGSQTFEANLSLDSLIMAASKDSFHYPDGVRADVSFINSPGELATQMGSSPLPDADDTIQQNQQQPADEIVLDASTKKYWRKKYLETNIDLTS